MLQCCNLLENVIYNMRWLQRIFAFIRDRYIVKPIQHLVFFMVDVGMKAAKRDVVNRRFIRFKGRTRFVPRMIGNSIILRFCFCIVNLIYLLCFYTNQPFKVNIE